MPAPDLTQLDNRLTALDGVGAQVPSAAQVPVLFKGLNGVHTTISQLTLTLQAQLNEVAQAISVVQNSVNNLLGIGGGNAAARRTFTTSGTTGFIDVLFTTPFVDDNYTATVSIESAVDVSIKKFTKKVDHSGVTVFYTAASSGLAATAHVVARHD
jgi:hypothetical protein